MAITLADFAKIWASTSPLTPYSFSDANYRQGWNFVGATPPARQMWDSYMKWSDEKQQYIVNNYLPLSGGTMTGNITANKTDFWIGNAYTNNAGSISIRSESSSYRNGATLTLYGINHTNASAGGFVLGTADGTQAKYLVGRPDGTLTWNGKSIPQRSYGFTLVAQDTYTFEIEDNSAIIFAKRGNNCSCHMVDYWTSGSVKIFSTSTDPITITKSTNNGSVTITNVNGSAIGVKILNGGTL